MERWCRVSLGEDFNSNFGTITFGKLRGTKSPFCKLSRFSTSITHAAKVSV